MNFRDLQLRQAYESDLGDMVEMFYEPVLSSAIKYFRLAGFFSSSSLAIAARGLAPFIKKGGRFMLVCNPLLSAEDAEAITNSVERLPQNIDIDFSDLTSEFERNHVKALGWMLANGYLEIKLALVFDDNGRPITADSISKNGIFHQKVGILYDEDGNGISFSGSVNESATGWLKNDEEFKVFRTWDETKSYVESDFKRFQSYWCNKKTKTKVFDLPEAVKSKLIGFSHDFDIESLSATKYLQRKAIHTGDSEKQRISLFSYQESALKKWISNGCNLLFEMATGTGKTRTAIACVSYLLNKNKRLITIVACPQSTLSQQWGDEFTLLGIKTDKVIVADGNNKGWEGLIQTAVLSVENGFIDNVLILTTHATASKPKFTNMFKSVPTYIDIVFVGDETHWLGAGKLKEALCGNYKYRVGLSATPSRWFDDAGSRLIVDYYGADNFEFTISDALYTINPLTNKTFLVPYRYNLIDVLLNDDEAIEYKKLTQRLLRAYANRESSDEAQERYQRLLMKRADLVKNAESKYQALESLLDKLEQEDALHDLIVFVSPQQKDRVKAILGEHNIISHELTEKQGTTKKKEFGNISERDYILQCFKEGRYKVLVAIKCLDEGIDIPSATRGILMASSTNPREYVQRIGRIIRQSDGKFKAFLYDMAVLGIGGLSDEEKKLDQKLRNKEIVRIREIAKNAINSYDAEQIINRYNQWH